MSAHNLEELVVNLLAKRHFLTASQLVEQLKVMGRPFNKTSVYRALDRLLADGKLCEHYFNAAQGLVYELRSHHHDHVACENCGQVWVSECQDDEHLDGHHKQQEKVSGEASVTSALPAGFAVTHHHITWFGLCESCQHKVTRSQRHPAAQ